MTKGFWDAEEAAAIFDALSQTTRLEAYRLLVRYLPYGLPAGDIARLLAVPHNTMSAHLAALERVGLVASRREGRSIIYVATATKIGPVLSGLLAELPAPKPSTAQFPQRRPGFAGKRPFQVLIVCAGNSARSIIAEAIVNRESAGRFLAYSAGSRPKEQPHPYAIDILGTYGYETGGLRSKSWEEFAGPKAPTMDFVITVCDKAAGEVCPSWNGHPLSAHWGLADPAMVEGSEAEKRAAFVRAYRLLAIRLTAFINLPVEKLSLTELKDRLRAIGWMEGATEMTRASAAA
jgi:arsenate reductase